MVRWDDGFIDADFAGFWTRRAAVNPDVRVLAIVGVGFDPRSLAALRALGASGLGERLGYIGLRIVARPAFGDAGTITETLSTEQANQISLLEGMRCEAIHDVRTHDDEGYNVAGRRTLEAVYESRDVLSEYSDVVVDISGMPRGMFFPLISYLIRLSDDGVFRNLHVAVVEDPILDSRISGREYGQADYLHTFRDTGEAQVVWLPLVGATEGARLEKIYSKLSGSCIEVCPILPFPARSMRWADEIAVRHADVIFEGFLVTTDNVLLCDERSPFDVYRKVLEVEKYYRTRLGVLPGIGAVRAVVSPLSSKTLALGMLLAAVERQLPVCHVEAGSYEVDVDDRGRLQGDTKRVPSEIWLTGEPYES